MLGMDYMQRLQASKFKLTLLTMVIVVLALALVIVSFLSYSASRSKRTIIIPSTVHTALEISDTDASPAFLRTTIFYSLTLLYSYTPSSAHGRYQEFLVSFVDSSKVEELQEQLAEMLRSIQKLKVSQSFEPEEIIYIKNGTVLVSGRLMPSFLGQTMAPDVLFLQVDYRLVEGSLRILGIRPLKRPEYERFKRLQTIDSQRIEEEETRRKRIKENLERNEVYDSLTVKPKDSKGNIVEPEEPEFNPDALIQRDFGDGLSDE